MRVHELMTKDPLRCREEDSLDRAAQQMWEGDVGSLPVVDEEERVVGMITDRDICMAAYTQGRDLKSLSVASAMSRQVQSCGPNETLAIAEERMRRAQVRRLPVIQQSLLVGVLSLNDLALAALNAGSAASAAGPSLLEAGKTLGRICERRELEARAAE
jgi:CBS domain-containing protein